MTATGTEAGPSRSTALPSIDGLRAIAVLLVVLGHAASTYGFPARDQVRGMGDLGNLGVRLFFVVSGFLITFLLLTEEGRAGRVSLRKFYLRRSLRIFPAFYVFLAVMAIATAVGVVAISRFDFLSAATYTMNFRDTRGWYLGHTWSLAVEEQFYLIWPGIFVLAARRRLLVICAVIAAAPIFRVGMFAFFPEHANMIGEAFPTVADSIATGAALAILRPHLHASPRYWRSLASPWFAAVPVIVFGINALGPDFTIAKWLVGGTVLNVGLVLILDRVMTIPGDAWGRLLNSSPASFVGKLSYSLYLWQQPFMNRHATNAATAFPVNVVLTGCCAYLSYKVVEQPLLKLKDRIGGSYGRRSA